MKKKNIKINGTKKLFSVLYDPDTWNCWRIQGKVLLSRLAYSLIALFAVDTIIAALSKTLLHPTIAIVGLLWISLVAAIIWYRGGVVPDALFGAEIINLEIPLEGKKLRPGHDFVWALALLGMIGVFITSFFLLVPIWQSWGLFFTLLVVLIGWRCAATLAESKFDWNIVRVAYIVFTVGAVGIIFLSYGHEFMTGQVLTVNAVRKGLQGGIGKLIFWPILLIIVGMVPKMPLRGLIKTAGIIGLLAILFVTFLFPIAKKELTAMGKEFNLSQKSREAITQKENIFSEPKSFELCSKGWSRLFTAPTCTNYVWDGPPDTLVRREFDGAIGPITKDWGVDIKNLRGFRFMGPDGEKVTVITRRSSS